MFNLLIILQILLIVAKAAGFIFVSWHIALIPLYLMIAIGLFYFITLFSVYMFFKRK